MRRRCDLTEGNSAVWLCHGSASLGPHVCLAEAGLQRTPLAKLHRGHLAWNNATTILCKGACSTRSAITALIEGSGSAHASCCLAGELQEPFWLKHGGACGGAADPCCPPGVTHPACCCCQVGRDSFWYQYIKELDRQRARGVQAVESPLLWSDEELSDLLQVGAHTVGGCKPYCLLDITTHRYSVSVLLPHQRHCTRPLAGQAAALQHHVTACNNDVIATVSAVLLQDSMG